ncbi:MAG: X-prolyl-dipeptidyl aminopeptidase, partial [Gemmatimonas sp. SG8_17]
VIRDGELTALHDRASGDYNDFWAGRDLQQKLDGVKAATLLAHGLSDWNVMPDHSVRVYEALAARGVPARLFLHQGGHGGPPPLEMMNRWFTHYLYGVENGVESEPRAWIVREGGERTDPTPYPDFPNPAAAPVTLHLEAGGVRTGGLTLTATAGQGTETLIDNFSFSGAVLARAEWTDHRLLYLTPQLADTVHISGRPRVTVRVASSKPAANLTVWLVSLPWTEDRQRRGTVIRGRGGLITRGWADVQNHASLTASAQLVPDRFYEMTFELEPDDQIVPPGQRIGLMIMSSDREFTLWPTPGTELTVDLDATSVELPVVGGAASFQWAEPQ